MGSSVFFESAVYALIFLVSFKNTVLASSVIWQNDTDVPRIVDRKEWGARPPVAREPMEVSPTPYVVIHHGGVAQYCYDQKECSNIVRLYQNWHVDDRGWFDIGYSFVIGEDGNAYEGRGWDHAGAHAPGYNTQSIGICVIGDFTNLLPNEAALKTLNDLINYGVSIGKISERYRVIGHRQVRSTECPGEQFYKLVQTHPQWTNYPIPRRLTTMTTADPVSSVDENALNPSKSN